MQAIKRMLCIVVALFMLFTAVGCNNGISDIHADHFSFSGKAEPSLISVSGFENMTDVFTNENLILAVNSNTMQFAIKEIESGNIWYSSPIDDPEYTGEKNDDYRALYTLKIEEDENEKIYNSYSDGVKSGYCSYKKLENGFCIESAVGKEKEITSEDLPQAVTKERFESKILKKLNSEQKAILEKRYTLYSVSDESIPERKLKAALEKYPILNKQDLYIINNGIPDYDAVKIKNALDSAGYGAEEINKDNEDCGVDIKVEDIYVFDIGLKVTLTDNGIEVCADCSHLQNYDVCIKELSVLPFFGASVNNNDTGFILLPDGSGSVVDISGKKSGYPNYAVKLYGDNKTVNKTQISSETKQAVLPAFGYKKNNSAYVAVVDSGDSIASINTNIKGKNAFSSCYASFTLCESGYIDAGYTDTASGSLIYVKQPKKFDGNILLSYSFLKGSTLYDMSTAVREHYIQKGILKKSENINRRLCLEVIGAVDVSSSILGVVSTRKSVAATTFEETEKILSELNENGINNIEAILYGFCNGGLYTKSLESIRPEKVLGGKKQLDKLKTAVSKSGNKLSLAVPFMSVYNTSGFSKAKLSARELGNTVSKKYSYDIATGNAFDYRIGTYISPFKLNYYAEKIFKNSKNISDIDLISLDFGNTLYSDMSKNNPNTREDTKNIVCDILNKSNIGITTGNSYTWKYTDYIHGLPTSSSGYKMEDYSVPFVQMVLSGCMGYSCDSANSSGNVNEAVLYAVASGADLTFTVSYKKEDLFYDTYYNDLISVNYDSVKPYIVKTALKLNETYNAIDGDLTDYSSVGNNVFASVFENGVTIVTNFNNYAVDTAYGKINAMDWIVSTGKEVVQ